MKSKVMDFFKRDRRLRCHLPENSYDVMIGVNLLHQSGQLISKHAKLSCEKVLVVTNKTVADFFEKILRASLKRAGFKPLFYYAADSELAKSEKSYFDLLRCMATNRLERKSCVIALGGGVVGDLAGFAASTYMRGIPFVNLPTTLLAQVDSAIGGKTGINLKEGKNLVGTFYQPRLVIIDPAAMGTLPKAEITNGLSEVIKYGVTFDAEFFGCLEQNMEALLDLDLDLFEEIIFKCVQFKIKVVERDERESGLRAILNFGHTFGHAIEALTGYKKVKHGMAVALGMQAAGRLALQMGLFDETSLERLIGLMRAAELPTSLSPLKLETEELVRTMQLDKKVERQKLRFILPLEIGRVAMQENVGVSLVKQALRF